MFATMLLLGVFVLSVATLTIWVSPLVTLATDLIVDINASAKLKAAVFAVLAFVSAAVTDAIQTGHVLRFDNMLLASFVVTVLGAGLTYRFGTQPMGISTKLQSVKVLPVSGTGLGGPGAGSTTVAAEPVPTP